MNASGYGNSNEIGVFRLSLLGYVPIFRDGCGVFAVRGKH